MKTVWAVMREADPVLGITSRIDLFDSEEKAKQFVDDSVAMSKQVESLVTSVGLRRLQACLTHQHFSIVEMGVR